MSMDEQKLISTLQSINTWWTGRPVPKTIKKAENKRMIFYHLFDECLPKSEIIAITGPRQVGKTTLMGQMIEKQIISQKVDPKRIVYVPLDSDILEMYSENVLFDSLTVFFDFIVKEAPDNLSSKVYVYLDEVQAIEKWTDKLKAYELYDNIKFIVSGSSQSKLMQDASESLVGRILFKPVMPMKFREVMEFHIPRDKQSHQLEYSASILRQSLEKSLSLGDPTELYQTIKRLRVEIYAELPKIKKILNDYLIKGGYPGVLKLKYSEASEKLDTYLQLVVYKDIYRIFKTRKPSEIMNLLIYLATASGQKINYDSASRKLGIDPRVVARYIDHLKVVFLVKESPVFISKRLKRVTKSKKVYVSDVGHRNVLLRALSENILLNSDAGLVIQTAVFDHACRLRFFLTGHREHEIFYWENGKGEVDIVVQLLDGKALPIEVKSRSGKTGVASIKRFISKNKKKCKWGIIVTHDELRIQDDVLLIPLWAFLLMC